ncbi:MAG: sugar ABC transporter permease [Rhizobiales bacterium]|nr:sugar ABC transporter permease [Hyphomicrobiales bacterium]
MTAATRKQIPQFGHRLTLTGLALPALILMVAVNAYPLFFAIIQSVHGGSLIAPGPFVGLENFAEVLTGQSFWRATWFTLVFTACGVFGSWALGFALALQLKPNFPGRDAFKVLLLLPWIVPIVVTAMSWNWLLAARDSVRPNIARALGMGNVMFLGNPTLAMVTVCVFKVWISYPFMMMMCAAALESVESNLYEASAIDGAGKWQQFRHIILPVTARSTYISWILMAVFCVNDFPTIYLLTRGGPLEATTSLIVLAYRTTFLDFLPGIGLAIAFLMTAVMITLSVVLLRQIQKSSLQ